MALPGLRWPGAGTGVVKELDRLTVQPGLDGDRRKSPPFEPAREATSDARGMIALLDTLELGQVPLQAASQAVRRDCTAIAVPSTAGIGRVR
jgi:hypothetical protein